MVVTTTFAPTKALELDSVDAIVEAENLILSLVLALHFVKLIIIQIIVAEYFLGDLTTSNQE
jgi:hypothetical protein